MLRTSPQSIAEKYRADLPGNIKKSDEYLQIGIALEEEGELKQALAYFKQCVKLNPDNFIAGTRIAIIHKKQGNQFEAEAQLALADDAEAYQQLSKYKKKLSSLNGKINSAELKDKIIEAEKKSKQARKKVFELEKEKAEKVREQVEKDFISEHDHYLYFQAKQQQESYPCKDALKDEDLRTQAKEDSKSARENLYNEDPDSALNCYHQILLHFPFDIVSHMQIATAYLRKSNLSPNKTFFDLALQNFSRVIDLPASHFKQWKKFKATAFFNRASIRIQKKEFSAAQSDLINGMILERDGEDTEDRHSYILNLLQKIERALMGPFHPIRSEKEINLLLQSGMTELTKKNFDRAIQNFSHVIQFEADGDYFGARGTAYAMRNKTNDDVQKALDDLSIAIWSSITSENQNKYFAGNELKNHDSEKDFFDSLMKNVSNIDSKEELKSKQILLQGYYRGRRNIYLKIGDFKAARDDHYRFISLSCFPEDKLSRLKQEYGQICDDNGNELVRPDPSHAKYLRTKLYGDFIKAVKHGLPFLLLDTKMLDKKNKQKDEDPKPKPWDPIEEKKKIDTILKLVWYFTKKTLLPSKDEHQEKNNSTIDIHIESNPFQPVLKIQDVNSPFALELYEKGKEELLEGNYLIALEYFKEAIEIITKIRIDIENHSIDDLDRLTTFVPLQLPAYAGLYLERGIIYQMLGKDDEALADFRKAMLMSSDKLSRNKSSDVFRRAFLNHEKLLKKNHAEYLPVQLTIDIPSVEPVQQKSNPQVQPNKKQPRKAKKKNPSSNNTISEILAKEEKEKAEAKCLAEENAKKKQDEKREREEKKSRERNERIADSRRARHLALVNKRRKLLSEQVQEVLPDEMQGMLTGIVEETQKASAEDEKELIHSPVEIEEKAIPIFPAFTPIARIELRPVEREIMQRLEKAGSCVVVGGSSVTNRYLQSKEKGPERKYADIDIAFSPLPKETLEKIFSDINFYPAEKMPGLYHVFEAGECKIDLFESERLSKSSEHLSNSPVAHVHQLNFTIKSLIADSNGFVYDLTKRAEKDLEDKFLHTVKKEDESFNRDPVQILQALHNKTSTGKEIPPEMKLAMEKHAGLLLNPATTSNSLREKHWGHINATLLKLLIPRGKNIEEAKAIATKNFRMLFEYHLIDALFPTMKDAIKADKEWLLAEILRIIDEQHQPFEKRSKRPTHALKQIYTSFIISASLQKSNHIDTQEVKDMTGENHLLRTCCTLSGYFIYREATESRWRARNRAPIPTLFALVPRQIVPPQNVVPLNEGLRKILS